MFSQNTEMKSASRKEFSDFGENSLISNNNSVSNTPVKPRFPQPNGLSATQVSLLGFKANHYNLTSPFKPARNDAYEIEQNFTQGNSMFQHLYIQNSPIFGRNYGGNLNNNNTAYLDLFHEEESTKHYSNQTHITSQGIKIHQQQQNQSLQLKSPLNI